MGAAAHRQLAGWQGKSCPPPQAGNPTQCSQCDVTWKFFLLSFNLKARESRDDVPGLMTSLPGDGIAV